MKLDLTVSIRVLALTALVLLVAAVLMAWASVQFVQGRSQALPVRFSFAMSQFPERVRLAFTQISQSFDENSGERNFRVPADADPVALDYTPIGDGILIEVDRDRAPRGWRYLAGAFRINGVAKNAVLLLNPDFGVAALWPVDETHPRAQMEDASIIEPESRKIIHGLSVLEDGGFVYSFDAGYSVQRMNACGGNVWSTTGAYHHSVDEYGGTVWGLRELDFAPVGIAGEDQPWGQTGLVALDTVTGEVKQEISIDHLRAANPDISIFDIPRETDIGPTENRRRFGDMFMPDPYHLNDVEPLPAEFADRFDRFDENDLLVSSRTLNSVFVVDPQTLEVVWHMTGHTRRQHDPDWGNDGRITVFDNRMGHDSSAIVAVDPASRQKEVLHDGAANGFYTYIRGKHAALPDGTLAVVSSQQGRAFEIDPATGDTVFELYSTVPDDPEVNYVVTSLEWVPEASLSKENFQCNDNG